MLLTKKNHLNMRATLLLCTLVMCLITSCKKEKIGIDNSINTAQENGKLDLNKWQPILMTNHLINSLTPDINNKVDWSNAFVQKNEGRGEFYLPFYSSNQNLQLLRVFTNVKDSIESAEVILIMNYKNDISFDNKEIIKNEKQWFNYYSGLVQVFDLDKKLKHYELYSNGRLVSKNTFVKKNKNSAIQIRANSLQASAIVCWDTYWVSFSSDGTQTWNYLYTSCGDDCTTTTILDLNRSLFIRSNCGGGGSSTYPQGDEVLWTQEMFEFQADYRAKMSQAELDIFDNELNGDQRLKYLLNAKSAIARAESLYPTSVWNGKGDAFRHAYWVGLNSESLGPILAARLAAAHEQNPNNHPLEKEMDSRNNAIGIQTYNTMQSNGLTGHFFREGLLILLTQLIKSGGLWIISPLSANGAPIDGTSQLVHSNE